MQAEWVTRVRIALVRTIKLRQSDPIHLRCDASLFPMYTKERPRVDSHVERS
jgi:hypothetical protein